MNTQKNQASVSQRGTPQTENHPQTPTPIFNGTIAREAVQCVDASTQELGDWLYTGDSILYRVSPVFKRLPELYEWAKQNGWKSEAGAFIYHSKC